MTTINKEQLREALDSFENHGLTDELDYKDETVYKAAKQYLTALDEGRVVEWFPIESAPKDGSEVLLYTLGKQCIEGEWSSMNNTWVLKLYDEDNGLLHTDNGLEAFHLSPTQWAPLPKPTLVSDSLRHEQRETTERED